jgi:acyl carrier protein
MHRQKGGCRRAGEANARIESYSAAILQIRNEDGVMAQIIDIVSEVLGSPVSEDSAIEDVAGWDSLKTLQIVMALDEAGYEIPLEKIVNIRSVSDILAFFRSVS